MGPEMSRPLPILISDLTGSRTAGRAPLDWNTRVRIFLMSTLLVVQDSSMEIKNQVLECPSSSTKTHMHLGLLSGPSDELTQQHLDTWVASYVPCPRSHHASCLKFKC